MTFFTSILMSVALSGSAFFGASELHLSTANCNYNPSDRSMIVEIEVYTSNVVELIKLNTGEVFDLEKAQDQKAAEDFLGEYLELNFMWIQDGKLLRQKFLKMEIVDEKAYLVAEVEILKTGSLMLKNMLFFEIFPDQINIVKVNAGENSADYYFNSKTPEQAIAL